jgi:hypothetical protein
MFRVKENLFAFHTHFLGASSYFFFSLYGNDKALSTPLVTLHQTRKAMKNMSSFFTWMKIAFLLDPCVSFPLLVRMEEIRKRWEKAMIMVVGFECKFYLLYIPERSNASFLRGWISQLLSLRWNNIAVITRVNIGKITCHYKGEKR